MDIDVNLAFLASDGDGALLRLDEPEEDEAVAAGYFSHFPT